MTADSGTSTEELCSRVSEVANLKNSGRNKSKEEGNWVTTRSSLEREGIFIKTLGEFPLKHLKI